MRVRRAALNVIPAGKWGTMLLFVVQKVGLRGKFGRLPRGGKDPAKSSSGH